MPLNDQDLFSLQRKVGRYQEVLNNTRRYREVWHQSLKQMIVEQLTQLSAASGLAGAIEVRSDIANLEAVVFSMGSVESGLSEQIGNGLKRDLIKNNGNLIYQQLFNGKILVLINLPYIEKYGEPQPPKTIAIYRPEELKEAYFLRHLETFITDVTAWEDYDDEAPEPNQRIGFKMNFEQDGARQTQEKG